MLLISLGTFIWMVICVKSTLMPDIKNRLEAMVIPLFGLPVLIVYSIAGNIFAKQQNLERTQLIAISWILASLFVGLLTVFVVFSYNYSYSFNNLFLVLMIGAIFGLIITLPTFYDIYLVSRSLKKHI